MTGSEQEQQRPWSERQRMAVDEAIALRARAVAETPIGVPEPTATGGAWPVGITRLAARGAGGPLLERRAFALRVIALALAWVEAIDRELGG